MTTYYESPQSDQTFEKDQLAHFTQCVQMAKTWLSVFRVLMIIGIVLSSIFSLTFLITGISNSVNLGMGLIYLLGTGFYIVFLIPLHKTAQRAKDFVVNQEALSLGEYLEATGKMWKMWGILTLSMIGLYILILLGVVIAVSANKF